MTLNIVDTIFQVIALQDKLMDGSIKLFDAPCCAFFTNPFLSKVVKFHINLSWIFFILRFERKMVGHDDEKWL